MSAYNTSKSEAIDFDSDDPWAVWQGSSSASASLDFGLSTIELASRMVVDWEVNGGIAQHGETARLESGTDNVLSLDFIDPQDFSVDCSIPPNTGVNKIGESDMTVEVTYRDGRPPTVTRLAVSSKIRSWCASSPNFQNAASATLSFRITMLDTPEATNNRGHGFGRVTPAKDAYDWDAIVLIDLK